MKWTAFANLSRFPLYQSQHFIDTLHPKIIPFDRKLSDESTSFIQKWKAPRFLLQSIIFMSRRTIFA